jgi:glycosyltransferase involved in cell wall biosynthesis
VRLLVIAPSLRNTSPGSRFRIEQWMPYFAREGVECDYAAFEDEALHDVIYTHGNAARKTREVLRSFVRRFGLLPDLQRYDAVFIYEEAARLGPAIIERLIALKGVPIIYDFCDPIYLPYKSPRNHYLSYLKFFGKTASICRMAAHVLVGNEELAQYARQHNPDVTIVPITIDTDGYRPRAPRRLGKDEAPIIGWSGSHTTVPHLDGLRDVLVRLRGMRKFRLRVIGAPSYSLPGVDAEAQPWQAEREVADLSTFDIGIMPLPDDRWTRLRTHLKIRQYMGLGIPCVASPVGVNSELIQDGVNGHLASTDEEWITKLSRLIDDAEARNTLGAAGRKTIEERYSAAVWAPRVLEIIRRSVQTSRSGARAGA